MLGGGAGAVLWISAGPGPRRGRQRMRGEGGWRGGSARRTGRTRSNPDRTFVIPGCVRWAAQTGNVARCYTAVHDPGQRGFRRVAARRRWRLAVPCGGWHPPPGPGGARTRRGRRDQRGPLDRAARGPLAGAVTTRPARTGWRTPRGTSSTGRPAVDDQQLAPVVLPLPLADVESSNHRPCRWTMVIVSWMGLMRCVVVVLLELVSCAKTRTVTA